jgi:hypothetical protein
MTGGESAPPAVDPDRDDDLLTRAQASAYLERFRIGLKPATLARMWSVGSDGPPCRHIRKKPYYPRGELRAWALRQRTDLRASRARGDTGRDGAEP